MYTQEYNPTTDRPATLWRGIDTIKIGIGIQWPNPRGLQTLQCLQNRVRKTPHDWLYELDHQVWAILPYGRKKYRYGMQCGQLSVFFSEEEYGTESPNGMIEAYPQAATTQSLAEITTSIADAIRELGGEAIWTKVSELHLTTDTHVPEPLEIGDIYDAQHKPKWISRARKTQAITNHNADVERLIAKGARLETMTYGSALLLVRIYNKQAELKAHPEKAWERGLWNNPLAEHATRTEFQIRREKLKLFGVEGTDTLPNKIPEIWAYLTQEWFTLNADRKRGKNSEATPSPHWVTVQNAWQAKNISRPIPRPQENAKQRLAQAFGNLISAAAIMDLRREDQITDLFQLWRQDHPEQWYKLVSDRQEKIQTLKGKLRIRDEAAELIFDDPENRPTTPLLEGKIDRLPPYSTTETRENRDICQNLPIAKGMLLPIPGGDGRSAATNTARRELRQTPIQEYGTYIYR